MTTDPTALAREVLDAVKVMDDAPGLMYLDGPTHECEKAASSILDAAPDLARAVQSLTAEVDAYREENTRLREQTARMEALADQYDAEARLEMREGDVTESINTQATADRIRAALNRGDA